MKKYLMIMAASAAVLFASCSANDDVVENIQTSSSNAIAFNAVKNNAQSTRASIIDSEATFKNTGFNVWAYTNNNQTFMDGLNIVWQPTEGWDYANGNTYYWPASGTLDFYAVSPKAFDNGSVTNKVISYSVIDEYNETNQGGSQNYDVMFASKLAQDRNSNSGQVPLVFSHILSQVVFKAKTENNTMTATVKSIKIHNVAKTNNYSFTNGWGALNGWYTSSLTVPVKNGVVNENSTTSLTTDAEGTEYPMLMLPQTSKAWDLQPITKTADYRAYLEIVCNVKQNGVDILGSETEMKTIYVPFSINWEAGYKYCYTLVFGGGYDENGKQQDNLKPITFDVEKVTDWVDKANQDIKF